MSGTESLFKTEQMIAAENKGTWHSNANGVFSQIVEGVAKKTSITIAGSDVTLTDTEKVSNEARSLAIVVAGTASADLAVIVPDRSKLYLVDVTADLSTHTVTFKVASGSGFVLRRYHKYIVWCDGAGRAWVIGMNSANYGVAAGTDTYTVTLPYVPTTMYAGWEATVTFTNANTGAATLNPNSLGAVAIRKDASTALAAGDISAGMTGKITFDGTNYILFVPKVATAFGLVDGGLKTSDFNSAANTRYVVDCDGANVTATGPASASVGDTMIWAKFGTGSLTFALNGLKYNGSTSNPVSYAEGVSTLIYTGSDRGWVEG